MTRKALDSLLDLPVYEAAGSIVDANAAVIRADLQTARIGDICTVRSPDMAVEIEAEVVGFQNRKAVLIPLGSLQHLPLSSEVISRGGERQIALSNGLLGRVVDAAARPIDGKGPVAGAAVSVPLHQDPPAAMRRPPVRMMFRTGLRVIDGLLTCGRGQRMGIFGEAGGGKSTLLAELANGCEADVCVIAMIGERGREVREFVEDTLGPDGLAKSVLVVSTSDRPAIERAEAAFAATRVAEYFRDQGKSVLLLVDSLTRYARAQRDLALAAGEMPARRGFPVSVFSRLPALLERAGNSETGSITAFYTVLVEGDGDNDPLAEEVRSIVDGHIHLSQSLAAERHYPAIDPLTSKSRLMDKVATEPHCAAARQVTRHIAKYKDISFLVQVGEYAEGSDPDADAALRLRPAINAFLRQDVHETADLRAVLNGLEALVQ